MIEYSDLRTEIKNFSSANWPHLFLNNGVPNFYKNKILHVLKIHEVL